MTTTAAYLANALYNLDHSDKTAGTDLALVYLSLSDEEQASLGDWQALCQHLVNVCL